MHFCECTAEIAVSIRTKAIDSLSSTLSSISSPPPLSEYSERKLKRFEKKNREYEAKVKQTARKTYFDSLFVMNSDMDQYGDLLRHLETEFLGGKNMYPSSLQDAINRLENYKRTNKKKNVFKPNRTPNVSFLQSGKVVPGTDGKLHPKIDCHKCKQFGQYAPQCTSEIMSRASLKGFQMMQAAMSTEIVDGNGHFMFHQNDVHSVLSPNCIVLDSASTVSMMSNHNLVTDIEWSNERLYLLTGGGPMTLEIKAKYFGMDVWFDPNGVANILSLGVVTDLFHVVFDSEVENAFYVKVAKDVLWKFERFGSGLYYFDVAKYCNANNGTVTNYSFITTVHGNKEKYHRRKVELSVKALEVYARLNRPSRQMFGHILTSN